MKNTRAILILVFIAAYATVFSLGMTSWMNWLGIVAFDDPSAIKQYPRFSPFCVAVGLLAIASAVLLLFFNMKAAQKFNFSKKNWILQMISAVVVSIPMIELWEMIFAFLQKTF